MCMKSERYWLMFHNLGMVCGLDGILLLQGCRFVADGTKFVDPMEEFVMTQFPRPEFPYRTTLGLTDAGWKLVKMCEPIWH